jgi:hypothetical protein
MQAARHPLIVTLQAATQKPLQPKDRRNKAGLRATCDRKRMQQKTFITELSIPELKWMVGKWLIKRYRKHKQFNLSIDI